jgi:hypothetical protein
MQRLVISCFPASADRFPVNIDFSPGLLVFRKPFVKAFF